MLAFYKKKEQKKIINEKKRTLEVRKKYIYILYRYFDRLYYITGLKNYYVCGNIMKEQQQQHNAKKIKLKEISRYISHIIANERTTF